MTLYSDQYSVPGRVSTALHADNKYEAECYLELSISFDHNVDDEVSKGLRAKDKKAQEAVLELTESKAVLFGKALDVVSGLIGLKVHRQFVLKPLIQNSFVLSGPEPLSRFTGDSIENLEELQINKTGEEGLNTSLSSLERVSEDYLDKAGIVLHWLLRAWRERDPISKFMYLFIPLEAILESPVESDSGTQQYLSTLSELVAASNRDDKEHLLSFLDKARMKFSPSLNYRFEEFASTQAIPGWGADVAAFKE